MRINKACKVLGITVSTFHECYVKKGKVRRTKVKGSNKIFNYNDEDIQKIINDREKDQIDKQIVIIDPKTLSIWKTYNNINEVIEDLDVTKCALESCLRNNTNTCGGYILKYIKDVTEDNIKLYADKHKHAVDGTIKCANCTKWFKIEDTYRGSCTLCINKRKDNYNNSYNGFFSNMACDIKNSAKTRAKEGKSSGMCTIDAKILKEMYEEQKSLCYYSGFKMNLSTKSDYQASPKRLDNSKGYTKENTRLICLEFNVGYSQWSKEKINLLKTLCEEIVDINELEEKIENAKVINKPLCNNIQRDATSYMKLDISLYFPLYFHYFPAKF